MTRHRAKHVRIPRRPQRADRAEEGEATLTCLVLADLETEWIGVDLASWAFVRVDKLETARDETPGEASEDESVPSSGRLSAFDVVTVRALKSGAPIDPARTEAVVVRTDPITLGRASGRRVRRLLRSIALDESIGAEILGGRGPSLYYLDIDEGSSTVTLLKLGRRPLALAERDGETVLAFSWANTTQAIPVASTILERLARRNVGGDARELVARATGRPPYYGLAGIGAVKDGHARKVVFALLPKQPHRSARTRS